MKPKSTIAAAVLAAMLGASAGVAQQPQAAAAPQSLAPVDIKEWEVPWENTRPRDPYAVSASEVWFVGQGGHYAAVLNPQTGEFDRIDLDDATGPHNLIVGEDGSVWYAGNLAAHIGRIDPATREIEKIAMPDPAARDPHTLIFDDAGDIWFTVQGGNFIGKLTRETEEVQLIPVPTERSRPYGIEIAADGTVWVVLLGTNKLASVDPETMQLIEYEIPRAEARPRRIGLTDDGRIWYVDYAGGMLGAYDPALLERAAWGRRRELFEYWGHEASLIPLDLQPALRWRMERAARGEGIYGGLARFGRERKDYIESVYAEIAARGPLGAGDLSEAGKGEGGWWGWSDGKRAAEFLFWSGRITTA